MYHGKSISVCVLDSAQLYEVHWKRIATTGRSAAFCRMTCHVVDML